MPWVAGVDGCKAGWVAVFWATDGSAFRCEVFADFAEVLAYEPRALRIAVDMPIGLPDHIGAAGRGPEAAVRPLLGARRNSVFSVPSRSAVAQADAAAARAAALASSDPPRSVTLQAFHLFCRIRQIDALLRADRALLERVFECHPEVSFREMNGAPLGHSKKTEKGLAERRRLLDAAGFRASLIAPPALRGAKPDDVLDACAAAWTARRIWRGEARSFPEVVLRDTTGLPIAIWA
jgi:predicted RNase H-like nuclease